MGKARITRRPTIREIEIKPRTGHGSRRRPPHKGQLRAFLMKFFGTQRWIKRSKIREERLRNPSPTTNPPVVTRPKPVRRLPEIRGFMMVDVARTEPENLWRVMRSRRL